MEAKIKLRAKGIELECEGPIDFIKKELPVLLKTLTGVLAEAKLSEEEESSSVRFPRVGLAVAGTTKSLAAKLKATSGPGLFKAAMAHLQLVKKKEMPSRQEILDEMRTATTIYRKAFSNNLTKTIAKLLSTQEINEPKTGHFSLSEGELSRIAKEIK
jgi:hypothetical protein